MDITITIPNNILNSFKEKFLLVNPKPASFNGTDIEWLKKWIKIKLKEVYREGKIKEAQINASQSSLDWEDEE